MTSPGLPPRARPVAAAGVRALLRGPRRLAQALTGRTCPGRPSTRDEASGWRTSAAPAGARSACAVGWRDTTLGPVTADARIHDVSETAGLGRGLSGQGHLDAAILRAPLGGVVRGDGIRLAQPPRRDQVRLHAVRDEIRHHGFGPLL